MIRNNIFLPFLLLFLFSSSNINAQIEVDEVVFNSDIFDFDTVSFGPQLIVASFYFTNNSAYDYQIKNVTASCGCTVPSWPKAPIQPGMKGVITAKFDPANLAGEVDKTIEIFANYNKVMSKKLHIQGIIREPVKQDLAAYVPGQLGYIRLSARVVGFNTVLNTQTYTKEIMLVNDYNHPLKIQGIKKKPAYTDVSFSAMDITPGDTLTMSVIVHGDQINDFGLVNDEILINTNDVFFSTKQLKIAMEVEQDFGKLKRRDLKSKPTFDISSKIIDMGRVQSGAKAKAGITIRNTGKSTLKINKIKSDCSCTLINNLGNEILPGETVNASITFDSIFLDGKSEKEIIIYTNDPANSKIYLKVLAFVFEN
jgi:Protein of unknown function (DUF1573)